MAMYYKRRTVIHDDSYAHVVRLWERLKDYLRVVWLVYNYGGSSQFVLKDGTPDLYEKLKIDDPDTWQKERRSRTWYGSQAEQSSYDGAVLMWLPAEEWAHYPHPTLEEFMTAYKLEAPHD